MKTWKSNWETLDWLPGLSMMGKRKKLFVAPPTILPLKFLKIRVIPMKLMLGLLESLCKFFSIGRYTQLIGKPPFETPEVKATYKKIKACQYSFPDHISISDNARNLITRILVLDPSRRPTLDEIMTDPFMTS